KEIAHVGFLEGVVEGEHGQRMAHLGETASRWGTHALARAVRAPQLGEALFDFPVAVDQRVVIGVGNFGRVLLIVQAVVMRDFRGQSGEFRLGFCLAEFGGRFFLWRTHDTTRDPSRQSAVARASSLTLAPDSMRAISSRRAAASSSLARVRLPTLLALFSTCQ